MPTLTEPSPSAPSAAPQSARSRKTRPVVKFVDQLSTAVITGGGIMVILAVLGIMVYLTSVVVPLFGGAKVEPPNSYPLLSAEQVRDLLLVEINEYQTLGMALERNGKLTVFDGRTGEKKEERQVFPESARVTAFTRAIRGGHVAFGFADGTTRLGVIKFTASGVDSKLEDPVLVGQRDVPVALLDYKVSANREVFTIFKADGDLYWDEVSRRYNFVTEKTTVSVAKHKLPFTAAATPPDYLLQNAQGDQVFIAWRDGTVRRYDLRDIKQPVVAETKNLLDDPSAQLGVFEFMFGDQSIVAGDSNGNVKAWFRVERPEAGTQDGYQLVAAHVLETHAARVTALAMSSRDKSFLSSDVSGNIWLRHMTSQQTLAKLKAETSGSDASAAAQGIVELQITPKADAIFALDASGRAHLWQIHNPHPETTLGTIFGKVWYEGYNHPDYTWQSSSGNDDFEPKFSLIPLIFGTLKATFYAMVFAIPIALMGAIYTSQFLDKKLRAPIKSTVETMASLPSVVLGFIAALVLAPFVENWIVACLLVFAVIPMLVILFGYFWQMMPTRISVRYSGLPQFFALVALVFLGLFLARELAGPVEGILFHGDFKAWLDKRAGTGAPGIAILAFPFALFAVWFAQYKLISQRLGARFSHMSRAQVGLMELGKLVGIVLVTTLVSWLVGTAVSGMGFDPRDSLMGTYVQRNTFIVGFVMGFAVIPIIYTISEDALSSVPEHLRSASLGCGATPWQTAIRVILPVGMSGIFSAVMIGLGRAVGETMIVVMAAGNTPIMDINVFNGLRALSANIAVELPEAVKDSTLFRMLFLAALTLFVITFVINTVAEIIRMKFRKRAFQL